MSYLPDRTYLSDWMTVTQLIAFFDDFYEDFNSVKAYNMISDLGIDTKDRIKTMSKGTKEKVQLILVMSRDAELYLLDEPIGGSTRPRGITSWEPSLPIITKTRLWSSRPI